MSDYDAVGGKAVHREIQENVCFGGVLMYDYIRTCLFACNFIQAPITS